jgi:hypothetical protein
MAAANNRTAMKRVREFTIHSSYSKSLLMNTCAL